MKFCLAVLSGVSGGNLWRVESQKQPPNLILQELSTMLRVERLETESENYNTPVLPLLPGSIRDSLKCERVRRVSSVLGWWYKYKITPLYTVYFILYCILYTTPISGRANTLFVSGPVASRERVSNSRYRLTQSTEGQASLHKMSCTVLFSTFSI